MKCITLWQPFASFVIEGWKPVETRGHHHFDCLRRWRIGIHAARRRPSKPELAHVYKRIGEIRDNLPAYYSGGYNPRARLDAALAWLRRVMTGRIELPLGMILGTVCVDEIIGEGMTGAEDALCAIEAETVGLSLSAIAKWDPPVPALGARGIWIWHGALPGQTPS